MAALSPYSHCHGCAKLTTSRDYFIAALSLYGATLIYSFLRNAIQSLDAHATFHTLPDSTIRISIPSTMKWAPGQHVFLRFWAMGLNAYTTHPFTICSLPDSKEMVFYVRPQAGITARLKTLIGTRRGFMPMSIDGPYGDGGVSTRLAAHTSVVLIAGGSGAGVLFPLLEDLLKKAGSSSKLDVKVVIAVRHLDSAVWISDVLDGILAAKDPEHTVIVEIYVTDQPAPPSIDSSATTSSIPLGELESAEKPVSHTAASTSSGEKHASLIQGRGRPDLVALIEESTRTGGESGGDVGVVGCGPAGMLYDIQEACADAQKRVLQGAVGSRSVWLHVEAFSW
jgi:ferredoxin-NADP reductase